VIQTTPAPTTPVAPKPAVNPLAQPIVQPTTKPALMANTTTTATVEHPATPIQTVTPQSPLAPQQAPVAADKGQPQTKQPSDFEQIEALKILFNNA
jgi:hypothetical protein